MRTVAVVVVVKEGLLFEDGEVVGCPRADQIAFANKMTCAEQLVRAHTGKTLILDEQNVITEIQEDFI